MVTVRPATWEDVFLVSEAMESRNVEYVIVGGFAFMAHGLKKRTFDIDITIKPTDSNIELTKMALKDMGMKGISFEWQKYHTIRIVCDYIIDMSFTSGQRSWKTLSENIEYFSYRTGKLPVISIKELLETKSSDFLKDINDRKLIKKFLYLLNGTKTYHVDLLR